MGSGELVRRRADKTRAYEVAGDISHARDFAVSIAEGGNEELSLLDSELAPAIRKMGGEQQGA